MRKNKLLLLLALLMTAATGAWAQSAFTAKGITSASQLTSTDDEAYVAACMPSDFLAVDVNVAKAWTGAPTDGSAMLIYAIDGNKIKMATFLNGSNKTTTGATWSIATFKNQLSNSKFFYTAASGYTVSLKDGVKDAGKWTVKVGEGQAQALPIGGLKGDGKETVTLQYNGRLKVKGVTATSDAAPAAPASTTLNNTITAWTAGTYAVPAGGLTYSDAITVSGDVTLTLTDGETLTLNKGISLASGATLTVEGNGTMNINGTNENTTSTVAGSTGTLILTSGTLTATGGNGGNGADESHGGNGGDAINGSVIVSGGTLTARGGNGGNSAYGADESHGGNGGDAISGSVIVSGGTLTARGGNGGSVGEGSDESSGGNGGDAINGTLTKNGGSTSVNDGSNGSIGNMCDNCTAGTGGKGHN